MSDVKFPSDWTYKDREFCARYVNAQLSEYRGRMDSYDRHKQEFIDFMNAHDAALIERLHNSESVYSLMDRAWSLAFPVPPGQMIPGDVGVVVRNEEIGSVLLMMDGLGYESYETPSIRTIVKLQPIIPDDCNLVWAVTQLDPRHRPFIRQHSDSDESLWNDGVRAYPATSLIDPEAGMTPQGGGELIGQAGDHHERR